MPAAHGIATTVVEPSGAAGHVTGHAPPGQYEPAGQALCMTLAMAADGHEYPAEQKFVLFATLPRERHAPAEHAIQATEPAVALKKPAGQGVGKLDPNGQ